MSQLAQSELASVRRESVLLLPNRLWQFGILFALIFWLYGSILFHLGAQWRSSPDFSHGFIVPIFSAFVLWQERKKLAALPVNPSWSGILIVGVAMCTLIVGQLGAELFLSRISLLVLLAGVIILFGGRQYFRALLFPWAFLFLMIPVPAIIFNQIAFPLQLFASKVASVILPVLGVPVLREGNVINLASMQLEVAEACSGIRSLMALIALAIIYGYLMERRLWVRYVLALASIPVAIAANNVRIIGTGLLAHYGNPDLAEGFYHTSWGLLTWVISLVMLWAIHRLMGGSV